MFSTPPDARLDDVLPDASLGSVRMLGCLLKYMPTTRMSASEALRLEWLAEECFMPRNELERLLLNPDE
jgi:hypothetical protein